MFNSKQITRQRPTTSKFAALLATLAIVAAACSADSADETMAVDETMAPEFTATTTAAPAAAREGGEPAADLGAGGLGQPVPTAVDPGRDIIFTAELTVSVDDVTEASNRAIAIIGTFGGFLFGQRAVSEPEPTNTMVFKVPPNRFQEALAALGEVGEIRDQTVSADDVTEAIVDLESRITTAVASVERLRSLLEGADTVELITELEGQLLARETALEQMRGQLRTLQDQVSLATITITITQAVARPAIDVLPTAYLGGGDAGTSCPGDSEGLAVVTGETVTYCLEIINVGDTALSQIDVRDVVLDKELDDFTVVFGEIENPLEPGQSLVLATTLEVPRTLRAQTRVSAVPLHEDGTLLEGRGVANTSTVRFVAEDPGGIPSFGEGLSRSWDVLVNLVKLLVLAAGALIPFIWAIPLGWLVWRAMRRRRVAREAARQPAPSGIASPPPPAAAAGAAAETTAEPTDG